MRCGLSRAVFTISAIAVLCTPVPAMAKGGPSQGVITGPGLAGPISLRDPGAHTIGPDLANVVNRSGFFEGVWGGGPHHLTHPPAGVLGPRYTITYNMSPSDRRSNTIVQYVYPYAVPRPVTHMPAGQEFWSSSETVGTWYVASIRFRDTLIGLGLPASAPSPPAAGVSVATPPIPGAGFNSILLVVVAMMLALVLGVILMRSHRSGRAVR